MTVSELAQHNVAQVAGSVQSVLSKHWKQFVSQSGWRGSPVAREVKASVGRSDSVVQRYPRKFPGKLSN